MKVVLNIPVIDWRPLIDIPKEYQSIFIQWRDTQNQVNALMKKDLGFPSSEYQQRVDLAISASNLNDNCKVIVYELTKDIGWYTEENKNWFINFSLEENDPFNGQPYIGTDDRPIISIDEYRQKYYFTPDGSIGELIELLSNFPPNWVISKPINIVISGREFVITTD